ncbi:hypothetical protein LGL55_24470 [Clostridium tagluense]|uniref:hypothetical protein n=1 Tax=Clostridium tagluense TaxID=360422 RepID=UPI001CF554DE|nr:hypothetical protein [Clostridium tagluense]MCB2314200.1 hypothetical protein [Clostridium tagluense]MCB2319051.1 hypothetical protein [Clostridium tagluense]MCB2323919.1 hypothetical protein [Clostridium tagluense]MCB2328796.1 hypothetical protein [Clostridium tagluense]MCB2333745.1 hypothetical protein [Clostridium tagluense]
MKNQELKNLVIEKNNIINDELKNMPNDLESIKLLLGKILTYDTIILEKLNKYTG